MSTSETVTLAVDGKVMPAVGLGLWKIERDATADAVYAAIDAGYRHLDSAADYGNERDLPLLLQTRSYYDLEVSLYLLWTR